MPKWYLDLLTDGFVLENWKESKGRFHCIATRGDDDRSFSAEGKTPRSAIKRAVGACREFYETAPEYQDVPEE